MVSAWRRDVLRTGRRAGLGMGKRSSEVDISVRFGEWEGESVGIGVPISGTLPHSVVVAAEQH
jgi:hypothetical protein